MRTLISSATYEKMKGFLPALGLICAFIVILMIAGMYFFFRGRLIMEEQLKDKLRSTAAAAAMQFDGETIEMIRDGDSMDSSPALEETVRKLEAIREGVTNIRFAYIMKRTNDPALLQFVADADLALSDLQLDRNHNSIVDESEKSSQPGEMYDFSEFPVLGEEAFLHPAVDQHIAEDQWGGTISGYAPIRTKEGRTVAVLGIDMSAEEFTRLSQSVFSPVAFLLLMLAAISIGGSIILYIGNRRFESLERLETERSGLLRLAFHQLGGPLTIISWSLEELETDGPSSIHRTVLNIQEGLTRLTGILKSLKDADIVHTNKIEYKPEFGSLTTVLQNVVKDAESRLAARSQRIKLELTENITMKLDPKLIAGVAQEILTNAMDFSPNGADIIVRSSLQGKKALFEIQDFGCGIPRADIQHIFDEFRRGSNATRFKADGNGLGLYIVNGIIKRAGGTIDIKSQEGKGTTVSVRLPIVA